MGKRREQAAGGGQARRGTGVNARNNGVGTGGGRAMLMSLPTLSVAATGVNLPPRRRGVPPARATERKRGA